ncbi:CAP domain-containing protein [Streptomyces sp. cmx-4-9]|uniref:CAP domain-containing protein n=1 Tax=Streptomyces sp. cmx-4-9 TaxID=2790941 RepID=UPI00398152A8
MQKHRKKRHSKKISIAAVTLGIVGIPTAAMACLDTGSGGSPTAGRHTVRPVHAAPSPSVPLPVENQAAPVETAAPAAPVTEATPSAVQTSPAPEQTAPATEAPRPPVAPQPKKPTTRPAAPAPAPSKATGTPSAPASGPVAQVVALVNKERAAAGCSALTVNAKLTAAAQGHSQDMAAHANMSHTGSDGSDPGQRITRAGYTWSTYGENVAYGYSSPEQVMTGWMNSPGHRQNILNCSFKEIGVGLAQPNSYWTQSFGAAR